MIKAPYNFVPLEKTAFYPEWANHISQDIPFEDGVSGSIDYTIKAETPIFVRNGYTDRDHPDEIFSQTQNGKYFIPGTSIKGEIRNVLEILSFGKMTQVQDARFGIRDLSNTGNGPFYRSHIQNVQCGWLYKEVTEEGKEVFYINDCGVPGRISPEDIDMHYGTNLSDFGRTLQTDRHNADKDAEEELKSAYHKYTKILHLKLKSDNGGCNDIENVLRGKFSIEPDEYNRDIARFYAGGHPGTIVVTGQSSQRKQVIDRRTGEYKWTGKYYEFVFFDSDATETVDQQVIDDFMTIHKNNYDFKTVWKDYLNEKKRIPVFFMRTDGNAGPIESIGIAYMFRIPSANFIKGAIPASLQSAVRKDLAECIFGTADTALKPLKGRVVISPAFANAPVCVCDKVTTVLGSPKPSYGPLYVSSGSWNDPDAVIKGRKRYPVRNALLPSIEGSDRMSSSFIPLQKGTTFTGRITFHNLRECELGAMISALTFNGNSDCYHSIGEAKPLGYGKVSIKIDSINANHIVLDSNRDECDAVKYYLGKFGDEMKKSIGAAWASAPSIRELISMAKGIRNNAGYDYMVMSTQGLNEFKDNTANLPLFTEIENGKTPGSIATYNPSWRSRQNEVNDEIKNEDNQALTSERQRESCIAIESHIRNKRYDEAQGLIDELNGCTDSGIRAKVKHCQEILNEANKAKYEDEFSQIKQDLSEIEHSLLRGDFTTDENKNVVTSSISVKRDRLSELLSLIPDKITEISGYIALCVSLIHRINTVGQGIRPYLPAPPFNGTPTAYVGRIKKYMKEMGSELSTNDINAVIENLSRIYPTINARERRNNGKWAIEKIRREFMSCIEDAAVEQILNSIQQ